MSFVSFYYIIFLFTAFAVYRLIPKTWQRLWLFACCVFFCGSVRPLQTLFMMVYVWIVYFLGKILEKKKTKPPLAAGIVLSVLLLFTFKYLNFTLSVFKVSRTIKLIAPIGISYIVFQCIAYLTEIYRGKLLSANEPLNVFLYIFFFPKVMSGPIEPPDRFLKNIAEPAEVSYRQYLTAFSYIILGFVKKMVVADYLVTGVDAVYASLGTSDRTSIILAAFMYSFQIYFDFSGYSDIAVGSAALFGINLTKNFNKPYLATGIQDFWRRWHISLSDWLKNYIYIPLGGNRKGFARKQINTLITFTVSGIWHGASFTYVIWGVMHGAMQVIENIFERNSRGTEKWPKKVFKTAVTFLLVTVAWIFFRIASLKDIPVWITSVVHNTAPLRDSLKLCNLSVSTGIMIILGFVFTELTERFCIKHSRKLHVFVFGIADTVLIAASLIFFPGVNAASNFIYFDF